MKSWKKLLTLMIVFGVAMFAGAQDNLLTNTEFDDGLTNWDQGWIDAGTTVVNISLDTTGQLSGNNSMKVETIEGGPNFWHIQRKQNIPVLAGHTYEFSFQAKALEDSSKLAVSVQERDDPWRGHLDLQVDVMQVAQTFGPFQFVPAFDDPICQAGWSFGFDSTTVWIDDVLLVDLTPGPEAVPVMMAGKAPKIDGLLDPVWKHGNWVRDYVRPSGQIDAPFTDAALSWRALWDEDYLYLFISVVDDTLTDANLAATWQGDSVELWLDGDNSKADAYDGVNDLGMNWGFQDAPEDPMVFSGEWYLGTTGYLAKTVKTEGGLDLEVAVPMANLGIVPAPGHLMGLDVDWNDQDAPDGTRDTKVKWFDATDNSWQNPSLMGTIELVERTVYPYTDVWWTDTPPVIDGVPDDLSMYPTFVLNQNMNSFSSMNDYLTDMSMTYQMVWDSNFVYYSVNIMDDVLLQDGEWNHQDDGVELWLDGDFSHGTAYDGINDIGAAFKYAPGGAFDTLHVTGWGGSGHYMWGPGTIVSASALATGGAFLEFAVAMDSVDIMPTNGYTFGHELDYNDDDDSGARDLKGKTHAPTDDTWQNPSMMSAAKLLGGPGDAPDMTPPAPPLPVDMIAAGAAPVIDGSMRDEVWENVRNVKIAKQGPDDWWDSFGNFRIAYDADNLYLFVEVHDDTIVTEHANDHEKDSIELFFDGDNSKNVLDWDTMDPWAWPPVVWDANDTQLRAIYGGDMVSMAAGAVDPANGELAWLETDGGYNLEWSVPLADTQLKPGVGDLFGLEIAINDNDGAGAREHAMMWWGETGEAWHDFSALGTAVWTDREADVITDIHYTAYAPKIDGEMDLHWMNAPPIFGNERMGDPIMETLDSPDDAENVWRALWDMDNLYFFVEVLDDTLVSEGNYNWTDDSAELYIDGDGRGGNGYDGINDWGFNFGYDPVLAPMAMRHPTNSGVSAMDSAGLAQITFASVLTDKGLAWEIALPLDLLGIEPGFGTDLGIEVDYNDDDNGDARDVKVKSFDEADNTWQYAENMSPARLVGSSVASDVEEDALAAMPNDFDLSQNYPNPFNPTTTIDYALPQQSMVTVKVYNMLGREVATLVNQTKPAGRYTINFDASHLSSGMYIYRFEAGSKVMTKKLMLIK